MIGGLGGQTLNRFVTIITGAVSVIVVSWTPLKTASALHELDCGPFRASVVDEETGRRRCLALSQDAQKQVLRTRELLQEQVKRTRDLLLQQKQLAKQQELIEKRERVQQKSYNRRHSVRQRQTVLERDQAIKLQQGLSRREPQSKKRKDLLFESNIERRRNQLEQRLELPRADLLDDQKALNRRLKKDQQAQ